MRAQCALGRTFFWVVTGWMVTGWLVLGGLSSSVALSAEAGNPHDAAGLAWKTHRTERFLIHYPVTQGPAEDPLAVNGGRVALRVATHAEQLFEAYQKLLEVSPPIPIHIVVDAQLSTAQAKSIPQWQRIEISSHPGPFFFFRDRGDWLRETLAHELAHLFLVRAGAAVPPGVGLELKAHIGDRAWLNRLSGTLPPDDLPGNPELTMGARVPFLDGAPLFWLEGGAEYLAGQVGANRWDAQRDMLLRTSSQSSLTLSLAEQLNGLSHTGLDGERIYNQGYAFLTFMRERYGEESFARLLATAAKQPRLNWLDVFEAGQGIGFELLNSRFKEWLSTRYPPPNANRRFVEGEELDLAVRPWRSADEDVRRRWVSQAPEVRQAQREADGLLHAHPSWSPDGKFFAYWQNGLIVQSMPEELWSAYGGRALNPTSDRLELSRRERRKARLPGLPAYPSSWSPDSKRLVVVADANWRPRGGGGRIPRPWTALFVVGVTEGPGGVTVSPVSPGLPLPNTQRAQDPAWSPDGNWISFVKYVDGTANLWLIRPDGSDARALTGFKDGTDIAHPAWSPDSKRLVFELFRQNQRDLWTLDVEALSLEPVMLDAAVDLQPSWGADGAIYFSSDLSGIFNVYAFDPSTFEVRQVTDVSGGAFMPVLTPKGNLTYVAFDGYAMRPYGLQASQFAARQVDNAPYFVDPTLARSVLLGAHEAPAAEGRAYRPLLGLPRLQITPELEITERNVAGGAVLQFEDPLQRHQVMIELLGGQGAMLQGQYTLSRGALQWGLAGIWSRDRRTVGLQVGEGENSQYSTRSREQILQGGKTGWTLLASERLSLGLSLDVKRLNFREREDGMSTRPLHSSMGGGIAVRYSDFPASALHGEHGVDPRDGFLWHLRYQLRSSSAWDPFTAGLVTDAGEVLTSQRFHQVELGLRQAVGAPWAPRHTLEWQLNLGMINRNVAWWDELKAGGMMASFDSGSTVTFPGYQAASLSGESLGILTGAWRAPLRQRMGVTLGPLAIDALYGQLEATIGNVWGYRSVVDDVSGQSQTIRETPLSMTSSRNSPQAGGPMLLSEIGYELRMASALFNRYRWNSFLHLGYALNSVTGVGDVNHDNIFPGAYGDLLPEAGGETYAAGIRIGLGLGAGF